MHSVSFVFDGNVWPLLLGVSYTTNRSFVIGGYPGGDYMGAITLRMRRLQRKVCLPRSFSSGRDKSKHAALCANLTIDKHAWLSSPARSIERRKMIDLNPIAQASTHGYQRLHIARFDRVPSIYGHCLAHDHDLFLLSSASTLSWCNVLKKGKNV